MKEKQKIYEKGITLIALVITIIVLLILAGVTLSIVFNGGIINKSQTAVDKYTEESAREKLSLAIFNYKMGLITGEAGTGENQKTLNDYISEIDGQLSEAEDSKYYEVELDGYLFWVDKETLEIISKGPSNPVPPTKIKFSSDTEEAYIGEEKILSLEREPQNASMKYLKWSVDNEEIATIKNGVLTGKKEGTVIVTVTSTEDVNVTATCTVTIKAIELTGITLNKTETTIGMGKTEKLEVTYEPKNATYKDITWSTNNNTIATVENGTIKGIKAGTAIITATSTKNANIKAECSVTIEEIIEISTLEELKAFRDDVNNGTSYVGKKVVLVNDLDLNPGKYTVASDGTVTFSEDAEQWTAIGTSTNYFSGTFDGQGHTISGVYINKPTEMYQGLFGYVRGRITAQNYNACIKNIILKDVYVQGGTYTGGIVSSATYVDIEKCSVSGNIDGKQVGHYVTTVGGIAGYVNGNIMECYNNANITSTDYAGGIVGIFAGNVINCYNTANISGSHKVGGIIGYCDISGFNIKNCYNKGKIIGYIGSNENYQQYGGIAGNIWDNGTLQNCYNLGEINNGYKYLGGIVGFFDPDSGIAEISNCYNSGKVNAANSSGGIIGLFRVKNTNINSCSYLTGTASSAIGAIESGTITIESSDTLPALLSVINGDNAFVEDTNNVNNGYPILSWQVK